MSPDLTPLHVHDVMSRDVVTVRPEATIGAAIDRVMRRGHTHLVVVDGDGGLLDVISAHLLTTALMTRLIDRRQPLVEVLAEPVVVRADAQLAEAAGLMMEMSVDALGVIDGAESLVGLLTWADIGRSVVAVPAAGEGARAERRDLG
ncbi:MAG TPA: CBS domain-containing protein [Nocardioides sp.]|nr:CBS domain-containing protein [Nocardioides sp.]